MKNKTYRIHILTFILCTLYAFGSYAEEPKGSWQDRFKPGNSVGNIQVGLGYSSYGGTMFALSMKKEYFIYNQIAVGLHGEYSNVTKFEHYSLGPNASYFIWGNETWRTFLSQEFDFIHYTGASRDGYSIQSDENDIFGKTFVGAGWSFLDFVVGYRYALDSTEMRKDGLIAGLQLTFFFN